MRKLFLLAALLAAPAPASGQICKNFASIYAVSPAQRQNAFRIAPSYSFGMRPWQMGGIISTASATVQYAWYAGDQDPWIIVYPEPNVYSVVWHSPMNRRVKCEKLGFYLTVFTAPVSEMLGVVIETLKDQDLDNIYDPYVAGTGGTLDGSGGGTQSSGSGDKYYLCSWETTWYSDGSTTVRFLGCSGPYYGGA